MLAQAALVKLTIVGIASGVAWLMITAGGDDWGDSVAIIYQFPTRRTIWNGVRLASSDGRVLIETLRYLNI